jgi:peptidoglycan/xylan/chitin deacetylase (PgdA/CDA1 family)
VLNSGLLAQTLLDYLKSKNISATFFVVGSRVIERPNVLIEEYMAGHEISVHTWSHKVNHICLFVFLLEPESN